MAGAQSLKSVMHVTPHMAGDLETTLDSFKAPCIAAYRARVKLIVVMSQVVMRFRKDEKRNKVLPRVTDTGFVVSYDVPNKMDFSGLVAFNELLSQVRLTMFGILFVSYGTAVDPAVITAVMEAQNQAAGTFLSTTASCNVDNFVEAMRQGFAMRKTPVTRIVKCTSGATPGYMTKNIVEFAPYVWDDMIRIGET